MIRGAWEWFGEAGHFIAASRCLFHLHTHVGKTQTFSVSTVGDYYPDMHKPELARQGSYGKRSSLTAERNSLFETMVCVTDGEEHGVWIYEATRHYSSYEEARRGHISVCEEYDR